MTSRMIRDSANLTFRLLNGYATESIRILRHSQRCWKSRARTIRTTPKRIAFCGESEGYLGSRYRVCQLILEFAVSSQKGLASSWSYIQLQEGGYQLLDNCLLLQTEYRYECMRSFSRKAGNTINAVLMSRAAHICMIFQRQPSAPHGMPTYVDIILPSIRFRHRDYLIQFRYLKIMCSISKYAAKLVDIEHHALKPFVIVLDEYTPRTDGVPIKSTSQ